MRESLRRLASDDGMTARLNAGRVRVELLTGEHITVDVERKATGADLLDKVCEVLDVIESDYFGLLHVQRGDPRVWVDLGRRLSKTFRNEPWDVKFTAKFYPPEPSELRDDQSRYQLGLSVRRDLMEGQTPAEAELNYLENAKKLAMYGAEVHNVKDSDDVDISLAVCAAGISVARDGLVMNRFPWTKILKISYHKRVYTLRLRASEFDEYETHLSFKLPSSRASKRLWRCSVEHHMFFRILLELVRIQPAKTHIRASKLDILSNILETCGYN
ncbi:jg21774 [Pararge aegeria aegeria]|uniref:Jg21774 protein n=1 Tax=Pararge aegeria aegeria TaxID=348720 RepID=A0A8S4R1X5_9NEOP|nr:jg21774 [Pararge aegeria aegeria]